MWHLCCWSSASFTQEQNKTPAICSFFYILYNFLPLHTLWPIILSTHNAFLSQLVTCNGTEFNIKTTKKPCLDTSFAHTATECFWGFFYQHLITPLCSFAVLFHIRIAHLTPLICHIVHCSMSEHTGKLNKHRPNPHYWLIDPPGCMHWIMKGKSRMALIEMLCLWCACVFATHTCF